MEDDSGEPSVVVTVVEVHRDSKKEKYAQRFDFIDLQGLIGYLNGLKSAEPDKGLEDLRGIGKEL